MAQPQNQDAHHCEATAAGCAPGRAPAGRGGRWPDHPRPGHPGLLERDARNPGFKESARQFHAASADIIGRLFPRGTVVKIRHLWAAHPKEKYKDIASRELRIRDLSKDDCLGWAAACAKHYSPTVFNHALGTLREIIAIGIEQGARLDNPASHVERLPEIPKALRLPEPRQFLRFLTAIETGGSGWSQPCANMVRFLAYGGAEQEQAGERPASEPPWNC
ncbi:MAG: hypothetical protein ABMA26_17155 [Limisphaerales bacterium]